MSLIKQASRTTTYEMHMLTITEGYTIHLYYVQYSIYRGISSQCIVNKPFKTLSGALKLFEKLNNDIGGVII